MILVDFHERHANQILQGNVNDELFRPPIKISKFVNTVAVKDMSFTGLINGKIVACGGVYPVWEGVGEAWFLGSNLVHKHRVPVLKALKQHLDGMMLVHQLHRVQGHILEDWPGARRWIKFLGMQEEGLLRKFSPDGSNYINFSKVI